MNEVEWMSCTDPQIMLEFLRRSKATDRKLRLFACACCREIWHLLDDERSRRVVEILEAFLDKQGNNAEMLRAKLDSHSAAAELNIRSTRSKGQPAERQIHAEAMAATAASLVAQESSIWSGGGVSSRPADMAAGTTASAAANAAKFSARAAGSAGRPSAKHARTSQSHLLRDIFGNPFQPVTINRTWLVPTVVSLAQTIYDERGFDRMPTLADALANAGCHDDSILDHCRSDGRHVRGCWVVDLVLGKE